MKRAIKLAQKAKGHTSPNPLVGAVLLDKNLNFIAEGFHQKYGEHHAEVNAINAAKNKNINLKGATIIVTLEPCAHYGKTPPCADLIIKSGIQTVIVGCLDPFEQVSGKGIEKCKNAGLTVITGILEAECKKLNEVFIKNQTKKLPFVTIKTATTIDGKIATKTNSSKWITSSQARKDVQKLRNEYDAIMTSSATVIADNPSMTCRLKSGKNPIRIIVDSNQSTPPTSKIFADDNTPIILVTTQKITNKYPQNVEVLTIPTQNNHVDLGVMLKKLYEKGICSILVEAGGKFNGALIENKLADKLIHYIAPKILGDNKALSFVQGFDINEINECILLEQETLKKLGQDIRIDYRIMN